MVRHKTPEHLQTPLIPEQNPLAPEATARLGAEAKGVEEYCGKRINHAHNATQSMVGRQGLDLVRGGLDNVDQNTEHEIQAAQDEFEAETVEAKAIYHEVLKGDDHMTGAVPEVTENVALGLNNYRSDPGETVSAL